MKFQPFYQPGDKIDGRYLVRQGLMGGMGEVYLCLDLETNLPYALKTFQKRYLTNPKVHEIFRTEVVTWVALEKHPNIVRCFHMDILDNQPFMVLEWIASDDSRGTDLRSWLQSGPLNLRLALDLIIDICRGLIYAQEKQPGIVHRDLKPDNILVAQGPIAKITDFGLAQIVQQAGLEITSELAGQPDGRRQSLIGQQGLVGTPLYMAPEQWRGDKLDARTDIYAVGCILYELLSGRPPFVGSTGSLRRQHLDLTTPSLPLTGDLPEGLSPLLRRCMVKQPDERYASVDQLYRDLSQLYTGRFAEPPKTGAERGQFTTVDHNNRALTYAALQQYQAALADYDQAIAQDHTFAKAYVNRASTFSHLQRYDEALADYEKAIALVPDDPQIYLNRGVTHTARQRYEAALDDYDRAIELDPGDALVYYNRAIIYSRLQQPEAALADYGRAIERKPNFARAYYKRGFIYDQLQQYEAALADYNRAIDLDPNDAEAYYRRGVVHDNLGQYEAGLADYSRAIELDPNNAGAYLNRGVTFAEFRQYDEALADYNRVIELDPKNVAVYVNRGIVYTYLQQQDAALADYNRAIDLEPGFAPAYFNLATLLANRDQLPEALPHFEKAAQLGHSRSAQYAAHVRQRLGREQNR